MEKCTYCVQRINEAKIDAEKARPQGARRRNRYRLPAGMPGAGDRIRRYQRSNSRVSKLKAQPLNYGLLTELNTKPRTTYGAKLRNPNPEIEND